MGFVFGDSTNKGEDCYCPLYMLRNESGMASPVPKLAHEPQHAASSRVCPLVLFLACSKGVSASPQRRLGVRRRPCPTVSRGSTALIGRFCQFFWGDLVVNYWDYPFGGACSSALHSHLSSLLFLVAIPSFQLRASAPTLLQQCLTPRSELRLLTTLSSLST
jgi:hypothetical protein